jgi:hypothetical protein
MTQGILVTPGYAGLQYFVTADGPHHRLAGHPEIIKTEDAGIRAAILARRSEPRPALADPA